MNSIVMNRSIKKILVFSAAILFTALPLALTAQGPGNPGCNPLGCPTQDPFCCVPIDGGLSLLIAAGIGLGAKKAYDRKKSAVKNAE